MSERIAGRELDADVAEMVMGWELFHLDYFGSDEETPRMRALEDWLDRMRIDSVGDYFINVAHDMVMDTDRFQPSRSMDGAWQVVEKMGERAFKLTHAKYLDAERDTWQWQAEFGRAWAVADTAPLAICLAALAALDASRPAKASVSEPSHVR